MTDERRLCRDCRHSTYQWAISVGFGGVAYNTLREDMLCRHPNSGTSSLITGCRELDQCKSMRSAGSACGTGGKLWEPVE